MNLWVQLAIYAATLLISILLRPQPQAPQKTKFEDLQVPNSEEGRALKVVFGTVERRDCSVVWWDDLDLVAIKAKGGKK